MLLLIVLLGAVRAVAGARRPYKTSMIRRLKPIGTPGFLLGTDELGRDMLARLIYGGRLSLAMGVTPVVLAFVIGGSLGIIAGYVGGRVNMADHARHGRVLRLPVGLARGRAVGRAGRRASNNGLLALTLVFIPPIVRVSESVDDAGARPRLRRCGAGERRRGAARSSACMCCGNVLGPMFVYATGLISVCDHPRPRACRSSVSASKPPEPEWGLMLNTLRSAIYVSPWVARCRA